LRSSDGRSATRRLSRPLTAADSFSVTVGGATHRPASSQRAFAHTRSHARLRLEAPQRARPLDLDHHARRDLLAHQQHLALHLLGSVFAASTAARAPPSEGPHDLCQTPAVAPLSLSRPLSFAVTAVVVRCRALSLSLSPRLSPAVTPAVTAVVALSCAVTGAVPPTMAWHASHERVTSTAMVPRKR
jgi:hypothetical protein